MHRVLPFALVIALVLPARAQDAIHACEKKLAACSEDLSETKQTLQMERQRVNALSKKALSIEAELEKALERVAELTKKVAELERQLAELQARYAALEIEDKSHHKELADLKDRFAALEKEDAAHHAEIAALKARIAELEGLLLRERELNASLQKRLAELEARIAVLEKENAELKATIASTKDALAELQKRKAEADARIAEFKGLIAKFQKLIDSGKLRVKIVDGRMVVEVATDILFASGSAALSKEGRNAVKEVAQILSTIPDRKFQIEGHTDNVPISTDQFPSNWELASARAITVVKTMVDASMQKERVSAASFADTRPSVPNDSPAGKKANRRIEIVVVPDLSSLPGFDELNKVSGTGG